ncbi:TonB-dependent receptor [Sphingomonas sp. MG17]|uniref:TonB-dependent receptor n=1 Tax=Sphingomonas tagetis TaxID=2949092 RepID=A0A9X2HS10_9SPHN|nr:TonB-dependent siderophore receptor [Sphingomonas tagetis]MCP3732529.1 TonB-dependent receptor [Sphingomonas tagetis]
MVFHRSKFRGASIAPLAALLASTAPAFAQDTSDDDAIIVTAQQAQKQVVSDGNLGALGDQDAMSTPFNVTTYTAQLVLDQQAETIGDVMKNDPSVRVTSGNGNQAELFVVRGFPLFGDDIAIDGMYGVAPRQLISPELYEGIQVLNGASAFLYGAPPGGSGVGGGINLTPKRAQKELYRATASFGGKSILGGNFDAGKRFGGNDEFGVRLNGVYRQGEHSIDNEEKRVIVGGLGVDYRSGIARVMLDIGYENQRVFQPRPVVRLGAALTTVPTPPRADYNFGQAWTYTKLRDLYGTLRVELDIAKDVMLYAAFGMRDGSEFGDYSTITVLSASGATAGNSTQARLYVPRGDNNEAGQIGLRAKFNTAGISHQLNTGVSAVFQENRNRSTAGIFPASTRTGASCTGTPAASLTTAVFCSNLYNAPQVAKPADTTILTNLSDLRRVQMFDYGSAYISDTLGFLEDAVLLTVGARYQHMISRTFTYPVATPPYVVTKVVRDAVTPVVGIVVKPTENISIYANRIEALAQGPVAPATFGGSTVANAGTIFEPYRTVQYEAGVKVAVQGLTGTAAVYQTSQPITSYLQGTGNTVTFDVGGEQRNRGFELSLNGEPTEWLRFIGGLTYTDATVRDQFTVISGVRTSLVGKRGIGVPEWQVSFGTEVVPPFLKNATFTGRVVYTDKQFVNNVNTLSIPAWTRFDLGARYVFVADGHPITLRVSAENVANKSYWSSAALGYLTIGAPRTFKASVTFEY